MMRPTKTPMAGMNAPANTGGQPRREKRAVHGLILLDKPAGGSSNKALQKAKWLLRAKKAGHTGSLDPLATGMLPLCFGEATKLSQYFLNADKGYETTLQLGVITDSADADGEVLETRPIPKLSAEEFEAVCAKFRGAIQQVPPMVSALKVDGKRLYKLAREGITVERKARDVVINSLDVVAFDPEQGTASLRVDCTKGTYIRSLVTDIGDAIGCGAHVTVLRRTHVSPFHGASMVSLEELEQESDPTRFLLPLDSGLDHMPAAKLSAAGFAAFQNGQPGGGEWTDSGTGGADLVRIYAPGDQFIGLGTANGAGLWSPKRVLQL